MEESSRVAADPQSPEASVAGNSRIVQCDRIRRHRLEVAVTVRTM